MSKNSIVNNYHSVSFNETVVIFFDEILKSERFYFETYWFIRFVLMFKCIEL